MTRPVAVPEFPGDDPHGRRFAAGLTVGLRGPERERWLSHLCAAQPRLRRSVTDALHGGAPTSGRGARSVDSAPGPLLIADLWWGWFQLGQVTEIRGWLNAALSPGPTRATSAVVGRVTTLPGPAELARIDARTGAGWLAYLAGEDDTAEARLTAAVSGARAARAWRPLAIALSMLSLVVLRRDDGGMALRLAEEGVELDPLAADPWGRAFSLGCLADALGAAGTPGARRQAVEAARAAVDAARLAGDSWLIALSLARLAEHEASSGATREASTHANEAIRVARATGERWVIARANALPPSVQGNPHGLQPARAPAPIALRRGQGDGPAPSVAIGREATRVSAIPFQGPCPEAIPLDGPKSPVLRVHAFAPHAIAVNGHAVAEDHWRYSKPRELLIFLLDHPGATKNQIGAALWPGASSTQIRGSFHVALHHLRRVLGDAGLVVHADGGYRLRDDASVWYDVALIEATLDAATGSAHQPDQRERAIALLRHATAFQARDFLPDIAAAWATARRNGLHWRLTDARRALADLLDAPGPAAPANPTVHRELAPTRALPAALPPDLARHG